MEMTERVIQWIRRLRTARAYVAKPFSCLAADADDMSATMPVIVPCGSCGGGQPMYIRVFSSPSEGLVPSEHDDIVCQPCKKSGMHLDKGSIHHFPLRLASLYQLRNSSAHGTKLLRMMRHAWGLE